ncbi:MAG: NADH dehydrogenase FAD-containing subunit, partial [Natronomonas sp.]
MSSTGIESGPSIRVTADTSDRPAIIDAIEDAASVSVRKVGPVGTPSPLCLYTLGGRTAIHTDGRPESAAEAARGLENGDLPTTDAHAVVEHDDT